MRRKYPTKESTIEVTTKEALSQAVGMSLRRHGFTIAVAESLTAGQLQDLLARTSGASDYFLGGITAYNVTVKGRLLGVDAGVGCDSDGVCEEVARQMALGALRVFSAEVAVATTGYAEPNPAREVTLPFAFVCVLRRDRLDHARIERVVADGGRNQVRDRICIAAAEILLQELA